jgi:hypothetical protein
MEKRVDMIEEYYIASNLTLCMIVRVGNHDNPKSAYSHQTNECYTSLPTYWQERLKCPTVK